MANQPQSQQPKINTSKRFDYRDTYSNSVQIRVNVWDFFLQFGTISQTKPDEVDIEYFQGIYLSPQQAKALMNVLQQNVATYEGTFGEIKLDARLGPLAVQ
jgi:flagellar protein FlaG